MKSEAEEKGAKVSDAQVKRYWKSKEDERIAPRVHQRGLSVDEKILRHFDLSSQYGVSPSIHPSIYQSLLGVFDITFAWQWGMLITLRCAALYRNPPHEALEASRESGTQAAG